MDTDTAWQLQPPASSARLWLFLLVVVLPMAITAGALAYGSRPMVPKALIGDSLLLTNVVIMAGVLALCLGVGWFIGRTMRKHAVTLDHDGLAVNTCFYTCRLGWRELQLAQARAVDLEEHTGLKPMLKTNGVSLPGYHSGWFRLRNGRRALVAIAGGTRVVHVATTRDYDLLLQPRQPRALLQRMKALAPADARG